MCLKILQLHLKSIYSFSIAVISPYFLTLAVRFICILRIYITRKYRWALFFSFSISLWFMCSSSDVEIHLRSNLQSYFGRKCVRISVDVDTLCFNGIQYSQRSRDRVNQRNDQKECPATLSNNV